mmetsp:Transcript_86732/g.250308  ORF Transcript_86732/g.250308 Transcript_86732/m.250308 type:complete len:378 (-) Transcript_86732:474-1607(-)
MVRECHDVVVLAHRRLQAPVVQLIVRATELFDEHHDGRLGRLACPDESAIGVDAEPSLVACGTDLAEGSDGLVLRPIDFQAVDLADGGVSIALHLVALHGGRRSGQHEPLATHLVRGKRAGLVGADHRGAPQGLDRWQLPDDGVALGHFSRAQGKARGNHRRQALRNGRDSQGHGDFEVVDAPAKEGAMHGIEKMLVVDKPHDSADEEDDLREQLTELLDFLLQGRLLFLLGRILHCRLDNADLSLHARGSHDADAAAVRNRGGRVEHVDLGLDDAVLLLHRFDLLGHALGLARELGLLNPDGRRIQLDAAHVRRNLVADLDLDNVTGHDILRVDLLPLAISQNLGVIGLQLLESVQSLFRIRLLPHANKSVCDQDQ